jgi:hypothetical protein
VVADRVVERAQAREHGERRQARLRQQRLTLGAEHQAGGRQVAVDDPGPVGGLQGAGEQDAHLQRPLDLQRPVELEQRVDRLGGLRIGHDPGPVVVGVPPVVDGDDARVHAQPLGRGGGPVEVRPGAAFAQRRVQRHGHRPAHPIAGGSEQAARDALPDEGQVAASGYLRGVPSHDSGRIYTTAGAAQTFATRPA